MSDYSPQNVFQLGRHNKLKKKGKLKLEEPIDHQPSKTELSSISSPLPSNNTNVDNTESDLLSTLSQFSKLAITKGAKFKSTFKSEDYGSLNKHKKPSEEAISITTPSNAKISRASFTTQGTSIHEDMTKSSDDVDSHDFRNSLQKKETVIDSFPTIPNNDEDFLSQNLDIKDSDLIIPDITVPLYKHQVLGLRFLLQREEIEGAHKGGLLCDDMGLGKTIQIISLITQNKFPIEHEFETMQDIKGPVKTTLIIAPPGLLDQWENEIKTKSKNLKVFKYHGTNKKWLDDYDVALTSIHTLANEYKTLNVLSETGGVVVNDPRIRKKSPVYSQIFWRIIIDEAHEARNEGTQKSKALLNLYAINRWCLTGTPIHNSIGDLVSLLKIIRLSYFGDFTANAATEHLILGFKNPKDINEADVIAIRKLMRPIMLRRTKQILKVDDSFNLKQKFIHDIRLDFSKFEKEMYDKFKENMLKSLTIDSDDDGEDTKKQGKNNEKNDEIKLETDDLNIRLRKEIKTTKEAAAPSMIAAFVLLLRLRQLCSNWQIIYEIAEEVDSLDDLADALKSFELQDTCILCHLTIKDKSVDENYCGSCKSIKDNSDNKNLAIKLKETNSIIISQPKRKTIIFTSFVKNFPSIGKELSKLGIKYLTYHGGMTSKLKSEVLQAMNDEEDNLVLICSLKCASVGLNLVFATRLILMEPWWNPQIEQQAIDRVYRIGQTNNVDIYKLTINDTVESRIVELQNEKLELAAKIVDPVKKSKILQSFNKRDVFKVLGLSFKESRIIKNLS